MDNYRIINMSNDKYDACGIKLSSGSNCIYFKNKGNIFNKVIIGYDYNIDIMDDESALVFKKEDSIEDIEDLIRVFIEIMKLNTNVRFVSIVNNESEEDDIKIISNNLGINIDIIRSDKYKSFLINKRNMVKSKIEDNNSVLYQKNNLIGVTDEVIINNDNDDDDLVEIKEISDDDIQEGFVSDNSLNEVKQEENVEDNVVLDVIENGLNNDNIDSDESITDAFKRDQIEEKEENLFNNLDIEPKIYNEKRINKKLKKKKVKRKKSKLVIILVILAVMFLVAAAVLFLMGIL